MKKFRVNPGFGEVLLPVTVLTFKREVPRQSRVSGHGSVTGMHGGWSKNLKIPYKKQVKIANNLWLPQGFIYFIWVNMTIEGPGTGTTRGLERWFCRQTRTRLGEWLRYSPRRRGVVTSAVTGVSNM